MKELSIEEKAKRYDEAIKKAESLYKVSEPMSGCNVILETIFPEFKESEDEKIRKEMIFYFTEEIPQCSIQSHADKMRVFISWLKRQEVERTKLELKAGNSYFCYKSRWERADSETFKKGLIYKCNKDGVLDNFVIKNPEQHFIEIKDERIAWLEKQGQEKSLDDVAKEVTKDKDAAISFLKSCGIMNENGELADEYKIEQGEQKHKIQPKFKIGDIIRFKGNETLKGEAETHKIVSYDNELYVFADGTTDLFCEQDLYELVEQNPTDKVEPKFKVGDWITNDFDTYKIIAIDLKNKDYIFENGISDILLVDNICHLWTIQDAKDGDVLACENGWTCIFNCFHDNLFASHCFMDAKGWFCEDGGQAHTLDNRIDGEIHPATKEQRDLLFQKMKEAGYEWDAEKKESRKIEQKQVIDYSNNLPKDNWEFIREFITKFGRMPKDEDELNVLVQYVLKRQKPTWSEEDKTNIHRALFYVNFYQTHEADTKESGECFDWLKSLRPQNRWKPSEEQITQLSDLIKYQNRWGTCPSVISELLEQLKKLREE